MIRSHITSIEWLKHVNVAQDRLEGLLRMERVCRGTYGSERCEVQQLLLMSVSNEKERAENRLLCDECRRGLGWLAWRDRLGR